MIENTNRDQAEQHQLDPEIADQIEVDQWRVILEAAHDAGLSIKEMAVLMNFDASGPAQLLSMIQAYETVMQARQAAIY